MSIIYTAATAPVGTEVSCSVHMAHCLQVNPPGASPILTLKQLWAGLEMKARYICLLCFSAVTLALFSELLSSNELRASLTPSGKPQLFLAVIDTCDVLEDDGKTVLRGVKFKDGNDLKRYPCYETNHVRWWSRHGPRHWTESPGKNHSYCPHFSTLPFLSLLPSPDLR